MLCCSNICQLLLLSQLGLVGLKNQLRAHKSHWTVVRQTIAQKQPKDKQVAAATGTLDFMGYSWK